MSLLTIDTCTRSNSSPIIRTFSKHHIRGTDSSNFDSGTSIYKSNFASSESDGEYETSSEGQLYPGLETQTLCRTFKSSTKMVDKNSSCKREVSKEFRLKLVKGIMNSESGAKQKDSVRTLENLILPRPKLSKVSVDPIEKTDVLVPSLLESSFSSEAGRSTCCFISDSRQTIQSTDTKSDLALSTAKNSTTGLLSVYNGKKLQSETYSHSIETDSTCKTERNRLSFEEHERFVDGEEKNIETNYANYELKKNLLKRSYIMRQIDKELAPLRDKINQIFNQVRIDLKGIPLDNCINDDNPLGISKSGYYMPKKNSTLENDSFLPSLRYTQSTEFKLEPSNSYRIKQNHIPKTLSSQERLRFNENLFYHPFRCLNHRGTYSSFNKEHAPRHVRNCSHSYLNNEIVTLGNPHLQDSFVSNSSYSLRGHRVPHFAENLRHISLNDFPVVQQHLHSFHANVLPVNSENLHQHYTSKVLPETFNSEAHTESKIVSNQNNVEHAEKHNRHSVNKRETRKNDSRLKCSLSYDRRDKKYESNESSSSNRPKPFPGRHRCKCKQYYRDLHHHLSPADNLFLKYKSQKTIRVESGSLSSNDITRNETLRHIEEPSQLITKLNTITKGNMPIKESLIQQKNDLEFVQVSNSSSKNTIKSEIKCSTKNSVLLKHSLTNERVELELRKISNTETENVLRTEDSSFSEKISDSDQKENSSKISYCSLTNRPYTEHKESIQVIEYNARYDKACNTESIDELVFQKEKPTPSTITEIKGKSQTEILNSNQNLKTDVPEKEITITSMHTRVSEQNSQKSVSNKYSKMSLPKTCERITIVPIIFSSSIPEPLTGKLYLMNENTYEKEIQPESQGRLSSDSNFSLSTRAESFATEITHLAKKCAFISDSKRRMNSKMTLNTKSSFYTFIKPQDSQIQVGKRTKTSNESRIRKESSRSSTSYETSENPTRNSVAVRRIRGISTSPEDYM